LFNLFRIGVLLNLKSVYFVLLGWFINCFDNRPDSVGLVGVFSLVAVEIAYFLFVLVGVQPFLDKPLDFGLVHELHLVHVAVGLSLQHDRLWHALVADASGLGRMVLAGRVQLLPVVLREGRILVLQDLLVETYVFGVLDLVLVQTVGTLPVGPMFAAVDLLQVVRLCLALIDAVGAPAVGAMRAVGDLGLHILHLVVLVGVLLHNVEFVELLILLLLLLVQHALDVGQVHLRGGLRKQIRLDFHFSFALGRELEGH